MPDTNAQKTVDLLLPEIQRLRQEAYEAGCKKGYECAKADAHSLTKSMATASNEANTAILMLRDAIGKLEGKFCWGDHD